MDDRRLSLPSMKKKIWPQCVYVLKPFSICHGNSLCEFYWSAEKMQRLHLLGMFRQPLFNTDRHALIINCFWAEHCKLNIITSCFVQLCRSRKKYLLGTMLTGTPRESLINVWQGILQRLRHMPTQLVSSKNLPGKERWNSFLFFLFSIGWCKAYAKFAWFWQWIWLVGYDGDDSGHHRD